MHGPLIFNQFLLPSLSNISARQIEEKSGGGRRRKKNVVPFPLPSASYFFLPQPWPPSSLLVRRPPDGEKRKREREREMARLSSPPFGVEEATAEKRSGVRLRFPCFECAAMFWYGGGGGESPSKKKKNAHQNRRAE